MVDGQVGRGVGDALVARAPVPVLTAPRPEHSGAQTLPCSRAVQGVVPAAVGLPRVLGAAATGAARQDAADRAQLHRVPPVGVPCLTLVTLECTPVDIAMSVGERERRVYSPAVLRLRANPSSFREDVHRLDCRSRTITVVPDQAGRKDP